MKKVIILLIFCIFTCSILLGQRPYYGGGHHTHSHGGHYAGGRGSSHKGGHYVNRKTNNHYGVHKKSGSSRRRR